MRLMAVHDAALLALAPAQPVWTAAFLLAAEGALALLEAPGFKRLALARR